MLRAFSAVSFDSVSTRLKIAMRSQRASSLFLDLSSRGSRTLWKFGRCRFRATAPTERRQRGEGKGDVPRTTKPVGDDSAKPILDPCCKNALVIGGSEGFGFAAADHLLCKGARTVIIADDDPDQAKVAVERLRDSHGKNRADFVHYDVKSDFHVQAGLDHALCKLKTIHILFNDLDKERRPSTCPISSKENSVVKGIRVGLKLLGGAGGIIVNCASIFGFMGWPDDPFPVYCKKEPAIEVTRNYAREHKGDERGVRAVALCPTNKFFSDIGLPDFPEPIPNKRTCEMPVCVPESKHQIGAALSYVLAWAENGSAWVVEPTVSVHRVPRLIHFPEKDGEKVDPKVYEARPCPVKGERLCVEPRACALTKKETCVETKSKDGDGKNAT